MLTVDDYGVIRRAYRDGMSVRAIARTFHHSRRKIRQVLAEPQPRLYTRVQELAAPKLGPFKLEVAARSANALKARIKQVGFPVLKDFDTYDFSAPAHLSKPKILELSRGEWIDQHVNCCLVGRRRPGRCRVRRACVQRLRVPVPAAPCGIARRGPRTVTAGRPKQPTPCTGGRPGRRAGKREAPLPFLSKTPHWPSRPFCVHAVCSGVGSTSSRQGRRCPRS